MGSLIRVTVCRTVAHLLRVTQEDDNPSCYCSIAQYFNRHRRAPLINANEEASDKEFRELVELQLTREIKFKNDSSEMLYLPIYLISHR